MYPACSRKDQVGNSCSRSCGKSVERGFIRLYRKIQDNPVLHERGKRYSRYEAFIWLCLNARGTDDPETGLRRGELEVSVRFLAGVWNWGQGSVVRFLTALMAESMLTRVERSPERRPERYAERFSICNYELYNPTRNAERNANRNAERNKYKEGFNEGIKAGERHPSQPADAGMVDPLPSVDSYRLSESLKREIAKRDPHSKAARLPDASRWAHDIDKLLHIDGRRAEDVEAVIIWCQKDPFWAPNILSGRKLREKFDTLFARMSQNGGKPHAATLFDDPAGAPGSTSDARTSRGEHHYNPKQR